MYARVVRFTGVTPEQIAKVSADIEQGDGPPPGVPAKSLKLVYDEGQQTAVVTVYFETEEDLRKGDEALSAMDAGETPGTRASVDQGEVKVEMDV